MIQIGNAGRVSIGVIAACRDRATAIAGGHRTRKIFPLIRTPAGTHVPVFLFIVCLYFHKPRVIATKDQAHAGGAGLRPDAVVGVAGSPFAIPVAVGLAGVVGMRTVVVPYHAIPVGIGIGIGIADAILPAGASSIAVQSTFRVTKRLGSANVHTVRPAELELS